MEDLAKKVEIIEKRLNALAMDIRGSLLGQQRRSKHITRGYSWVEQLFEGFREISAKLETVQKTLSAGVHSAYTQSDRLVMNYCMIEAEQQ